MRHIWHIFAQNSRPILWISCLKTRFSELRMEIFAGVCLMTGIRQAWQHPSNYLARETAASAFLPSKLFVGGKITTVAKNYPSEPKVGSSKEKLDARRHIRNLSGLIRSPRGVASGIVNKYHFFAKSSF